MKIAKRALGITPSLTLELTAKAKKLKEEGRDVVSFGAGEPDFNTPEYIRNAAKEALDKGLTKYTPASGTASLKQAICDKLKRDNGLDYTPANIVVSNGAKHALSNAIQAIVEEGDEVINVETYDTDEFSTMFFVSRAGFALNAVKDNLPVQGRVAGGVRGIALSAGGECIFGSQINGEGEIVVVTAAGGFKRVISSLIDPIGRNCKGVIIADVKDCRRLLFADYVTIPYTLAVINSDGSVAELNTEDISIENRVTKGKKLKRNPPLDPVRVVALKQKSDESIQLKF